MDLETLGALAALATIGGFLLELAETLYRLCKRWSAQRMARKEASKAASEENE